MKRNMPQRNNNPLNVRYAHQPESTGPDKDGYAIFPFPEVGFHKMHGIIDWGAIQGMHLTEFINTIAPPNENDTQKYIDFVCVRMNCGPFTPLIDLCKYALGGVLAKFEGYFGDE